VCGFVGYVGAPVYDLVEAAESILHRGPDSQVIRQTDEWSVAFNRLAIIDTSTSGMQPFSFQGVTVFVNGEIYNYKELRSRYGEGHQFTSGSDAEVIPLLYKRFGVSFLSLVNGMFSMVIIDDDAEVVLLVRDRFGQKPLFFTNSGDHTFFASEIKALASLVSLKIDRVNVAANLYCWVLPQPLTLFENVQSVLPGSVVEIRQKKITQHRWYEPRLTEVDWDLGELQERIIELLTDSDRLCLQSDVPVGLFLSGGLDSLAMHQIALGKSPDFNAFHATIEGKAEWEGNDTDTDVLNRYCSENPSTFHRTTVSASYWLDNASGLVNNYDSIFADSGLLVFYALAEEASKKGVKVILTGVGGDELFGGYPWQARLVNLPQGVLANILGREITSNGRLPTQLTKGTRDSIPGKIRARILSRIFMFTFPRLWHASSLSGAFRCQLDDVIPEVFEVLTQTSNANFTFANAAVPNDSRNSINFANMGTVVTAQNGYADMACMNYSVENRSPMLDHRLVELMMSVSHGMKNGARPKELFRGSLSEVLPEYVLNAGKSGPTMPLSSWFQNKEVRDRSISVVLRGKDMVGDLVSSNLASSLVPKGGQLGPAESMRLFASTNLVLWLSRIEGAGIEL